MKWPMPSGWQFIIYGSFVVALVCIVHSIDEIRFESVFKLDKIPLFLPETFHHSINETILGNTPPNSTIFLATTTTDIPKKPQQKIQFPLNCTFGIHRTCPANYYPTSFPSQDDQDSPSTTTTCPDYFRWIYEDLRLWKEIGITREMVEERARVESNFRLVILNGRAYIERYRKGFETRDLFTQWGILQLLRRYPGKLPDLDLVFSVSDRPVIKSTDYSTGPNATAPPPLFRYCGTDDTLSIVFPDWSFWGWAEVNIKPWERILEELKKGDKRWKDKEAYAYWKGTPLSRNRRDLLKCNISDKQHWGARLYLLDWKKERQEGFKQSNLASQCMHRYKIYLEGFGWSVSEKYILACNSITLLVKPRYYDFFTRGLMPMNHYWPIKEYDQCRSIKFAVEWGNNHEQEAQDIVKAASDFIHEDLKMDYVYDYMFHVLREYAKLLRYKPTIPERAFEICSETLACPAVGLHKTFMMESMVKGPIDVSPCNMPPPYDPHAFRMLLRSKANSVSLVELWEQRYWENQAKHN
ncbi:hypothetical protein RHSIM_Rhsim03G0184400 [Rhododendron simsii]|uniref:Glycosyl transferase CAP10 domain-containing protein n=1 Tax=Rhododendron simsii TaxID=118357 RepID=A0A834HHE2_RHOSS|nr:hypothetical protein RHSIM_Rhsim03G0184400 [Rhododendron simsii]